MNKFKKCVFIILGLCFVSCSEPSLFEGLDLPDTELISTYEGEKLLDELSKNINSKSFYQELTQVQKQKILSNLDKMIFVHPKSSEFNQQNLIKAASFAIEILIYTNSLSYAVIYDLTNPLLVLLSGQNISPQNLFEVYIQPVKEKIQTEGQNCIQVISDCFYNLLQISNYYNAASSFVPEGFYSGGDLQKYLVSSFLSGIIELIQTSMNYGVNVTQDISDEVAQLILDSQMNAESINSVLEYLWQEIPKRFASTGTDFVQIYKQQFEKIAQNIKNIATSAGYSKVADLAISVLQEWI